MTITEIRQLLESPYNQKEWKVFLQSHFTNGKLFGDAHSIELTDKNLCKKCYSLGNYEVNEYTKIGIFEVQLNDNVKLTRNRVGLRNLIKSITQQVAGAMVVFVQGDKWRFSYISKRKVKNKETNTIEDKETAPKRYTYLFGKNEKALTAAIRFDKLIQKQQGNIFQFLTLNDFEEAFSVEKLSKDFFNEYKKSYEDFVEFITGKRYLKKGNKFVETVIHPANFQLRNLFGNDEKQARDFCKRMMGRIVFLYFIQKKGWLAAPAMVNDKLLMINWGQGDQDYLFNLFKNSKHKDDFYSQELVPLFFKTLNNPQSQTINSPTNNSKSNQSFNQKNHSSDNVFFPYLNGGLFDDSHDRKFNKLALPTEIFERLFNTFNNFNFTVYEDAPDEQTVAVDPEMLGHIFENLLEDNKDKGAFYTPKEIVHYMCRESLFQYIINNEELKIKNEDDRAVIKKIIEQAELTKEEIAFAEKNAYKIIDALEQVKICDPAIGSGAFPMGILQEIFNAQIYLQELKGFTRKQTEAEIKKHIIEESIYGVDIDAGAVDIARLRFWLSLVVDENEPQPLPNLDFKIVCANTLIPSGYDKFIELAESTQTPTLLRMDGEIQKLQAIRDKYFNEGSKEQKDNLKKEFLNTRNYILDEFKSLRKAWNLGDFIDKIAQWNPFEDTSCTWFDAWWMFGVKDGFDIVIGNPPYGAKLTAGDKKLYYSIYKHQDYQLDTYLLFIEKSFQIMKANAVNAFIIPNTWLINLKLEKFRKYIVEQNTILNIVHYHKSVFENAVVDTQVVIFKKQISNNNLVQILEYIDIENPSITTINQDKWKNLNGEPINIFINESSQAIIDIIKQNGSPLISICNVANGMKPYEIGKGTPIQTKQMVTDRVYDAEYKVDSSYRELLRGRDINKYVTLWDGKRWIKYGDNLGAPRYSANFDLPEKIVIRQTSDRLIATLDTKKFVCMNNLHIVNPKDKNYNLKYVLAIINSRLMDFYYETLNPEKGEALAEVKKENVEKLLIKLLEPAKQTPFVNLVDYLLFLNDKQSEQLFPHTSNERIAAHIEDVLNMMVYELYFEEHIKEAGIDVLSMINDKLLMINEDKTLINNLPLTIKHFYNWYMQPNNEVRKRIETANEKSPNIISKINLATQ